MPDLAVHDVLVGGSLGYLNHRDGNGVSLGYVAAFDDQTVPRPLQVNGITVTPTREFYLALGDPTGEADEDPHDIVYVDTATPTVAALVAFASNTLQLWRLTTDGAIISKVSVATEPGWTRDKIARIDIGCDENTIYYTTRQKTIFRWDLAAGTQMPAFDTLPAESPYIYAAFKRMKNGDFIVAMTSGGNGPQNAVALDATGFWTEEVAPADEVVHVFKRHYDDGSDLLSFAATLDPSGTNGEVTALAVPYEVCAVVARRRVQSALIA
jgi:hypothetical protein